MDIANKKKAKLVGSAGLLTFDIVVSSWEGLNIREAYGHVQLVR